MNVEEITIDIPGLRLAARAWGPADGQPVLAMHGWLDNAATFDRLAPLMPETLRLVVLDLPGHGLSEHRPAGSSYHFVDWVACATDAADALGWSRFSILAHSLGAAVGLLVAGACPERIERLALIDGLGPWTLPDEDAVRQLRRGLDERAVLLRKQPRHFRSIDEAVETLGGVYTDLSPGSLRLLVERGSVAVAGGVTFRYDLALRAASLYRMTEGQVLSILQAITCPVLLVRPRAGWPFEPEAMRQRLEAIARHELLEVDGGHHVHLEHPERVAGPIVRFLTPPTGSIA